LFCGAYIFAVVLGIWAFTWFDRLGGAGIELNRPVAGCFVSDFLESLLHLQTVVGQGLLGGGDFAAALPGTPVTTDIDAVDLPLYGRIAAGTPIEALRDQCSSVQVPGTLLGRGEHYALEVAGDSMIEAGILDGDTVIIQRSDTADNGSIVVALIDNIEVTLKRLRRRGASIALEPANKAYETRIFGPDRVQIQGRLVGLLRRYLS